MSLGKVSIAIEAQMASFESDMGRAARVAEKNLRKIEADARKTEAQMKAIGKAMGLAIVAGATAATVALKGAINAMDDMSKAAQKANMPTEDFSRLAYAGKLADVSMEDLTGSLGKLAKAQGDSLKATSEQGRVFEALGISVKNTDGTLRATGDVFKDFADRFQEMKGSPEIVAAGMAIFGRSFQNLIPLLKDGSAGLGAAADEADRLGITLSTKAGQQAEEFNDNLTRLQSAAQGFGLAVAQDLLPDLERLSAELVNNAKNGDLAAETARAIRYSFEAVGAVLGPVGTMFSQVGQVIEGLTMNMMGLAEVASGVINLDWGRIKAGMNLTNEARGVIVGGVTNAPGAGGTANGPRVLMSGRDKMPESMMRAANDDAPDMAALRLALGGGPAKAKKGGASKKSDAEREAESLQRAYDSLMESQRERIALFGQESEVSKATYDTQHGAMSALTEAEKAAYIEGARKLDLMKASADELKKAIDLEEKATKAADDHAKSVKDFIADQEFELKLLGMSNIERERAIALRIANADAASKEGQTIIDNVNKINAAAENAAFIEDFKTGLADAFVEFASGAKSASEAFNDFADSMYKRILQIMADRMITAFFDNMSGGGASTSGTGGGINWGAMIGSFFGGGKADGGAVSSSKFYEVGEGNRPEILRSRGKSYLIPGNDGNVIPFPRGGSGGAGMTNHFHYQAPYDARTESQKNARLAYETGRASGRNR